MPEESYTIPLSQSDVKRTGSDLTVIATAIMVPRALEAAGQLASEGIELEVVDPRTLKPLDTEPIVRSVCKTGKALVVHEAPVTGGFGGEVMAQLAASEAFDYLDAPVRRLDGAGLVPSPVQILPPAELPAEEVLPLQGMRRTIADRMTLSYQAAPHVTFTVEADMSAA